MSIFASVRSAGTVLILLLIAQGAGVGRAAEEHLDRGARSSLPLKTTRHIRFTTGEGTWMSLDVSPDGKIIVFDLLGDLYLLPINGGTARHITSGPAWDSGPRFSPDGRQIAFVSDRDGATNVWMMEVAGGRLRQISHENEVVVGSLDWLPDGRTILACRSGVSAFNQSIEGNHLWVYPTDGGPGERLRGSYEQEEKGYQESCDASVEQRRSVVYANVGGDSGSVYKIDLKTGAGGKVPGLQANARRGIVSPDGKFLAYPVPVGIGAVLRLLDLKTGEDRLLAPSITRDSVGFDNGSNDYNLRYSFTPDSRSVIYTDAGHIQRVDIATSTVTPIPFTATVDQELAPLLMTVHRVDSNELTVRQMTGFQLVPGSPTSPPKLIFSAVGRIWITELLNPAPRPLTVRHGWGGYAVDPAISPDGRWIAYATLPDSGQGHLWKIPITGGQPLQLDEPAGAAEYSFANWYPIYSGPLWSPDGQRVIATRVPPLKISNDGDVISGPALISVAAAAGSMRLVRDFARDGTEADTEQSEGPWDRLPGAVRATAGMADAKTLEYQFIANYFDPASEPGMVGSGCAVKSASLDGQRDHALFIARDLSNDLSPVTRNCALSPDGRFALIEYHFNAYLLEVPHDGKPVALDHSPSGAIQLSLEGARDLQWLDHGKTVAWGYANHFYRLPLSDVLAAPADRTKWHILDVSIPLQVPRPTPQGSIVLRGARLVTMRGDEVIEHGDVVIDQDRITAVGPSGTIPIPARAKILDVGGTTIIPGLIDTHIHPDFNAVHDYLPDEMLRRFAMGVTTFRDPNGSPNRFFESEDIDTTSPPEPRLYTTGPGMMVWVVGYIHNFAEAEHLVHRYVADGAVGLKNYQQPTRIQRQWLRMAAEEEGVNITAEGANRSFAFGMSMVLDGYTGIEHAPNFGLNWHGRMYHDAVELLARSGTTYTPAVLNADEHILDDPRIVKFTPPPLPTERTPEPSAKPEVMQQARNARDVVRMGGRMSVGSHDGAAIFNLHSEMLTYALGGMTPLEVLRCATLFGAQAIGYGADLGSIEPGKLADLVILNRNPLDDIRKARDIRYVMKGGVLYESLSLDEIWPEEKPLPPLSWQSQP